MERLLFLAAAGHQRWAGMLQGHEEHVDMPRRLGAGEFLIPDELAGERQAAAAIGFGPGDVAPAALELTPSPRDVEIALRIAAFGRPLLCWDVRGEPVTQFRAK